MMESWFKMHTDILDDPKFMELSDSDFRVFVLLLAYARELKQDGRINMKLTELSWRLRMDEKIVKSAIKTLLKLKILHCNADDNADDNAVNVQFLNWKKRQYTEGYIRVKRHREKQRDNADDNGNDNGMKRNDNADDNGMITVETETETETETDKKPLAPNQKKITFDFGAGTFTDILEKDFKIWHDAYPACDVQCELNKMAAWLVANPAKRKSNYKRFITNWLSRSQDNGGTRGYVPEKEPEKEKRKPKQMTQEEMERAQIALGRIKVVNPLTGKEDWMTEKVFKDLQEVKKQREAENAKKSH